MTNEGISASPRLFQLISYLAGSALGLYISKSLFNFTNHMIKWGLMFLIGTLFGGFYAAIFAFIGI